MTGLWSVSLNGQAKDKFQTKTKVIKDLNDRELVKRIKDGEKEYQGELYRRYSTPVYRKCLQLLSDRSVAQDLTHDIMVKVLLRLHQLNDGVALQRWIFVITYNHCMTYMKRAGLYRIEALDESKHDTFTNGDDQLAQKQLLELKLEELQKLLVTLRDEEKIILIMRYQDGMSVKQIAVVLELSISAVKMRLKRSRDHLAILLKRAVNG